MRARPSAPDLTVLGIETSCDETAASVVRGLPPGPGKILSNLVSSQWEAHRPYGGVVPEIAARAHVERLDVLLAEALEEARVTLAGVDAVAATAGPGLIGGVMVGLTAAKALALAADKPLIAVNHLEAHALTPRLAGGTAFPYLLLLASGGHCQLVAVAGVGSYRVLGSTIDDAIGEAFDKTAKLLGLPYPGGPAVEALAAHGNPQRFALPRPMLGRAEADFSFSGLKTAVRHAVEQAGPLTKAVQADMAAAFLRAVVEIVEDRVRVAMQQFRQGFPQERGLYRLVAAGGVAANGPLRMALKALARREGFALTLPPPALCTDNGAMAAWVGLERCALGLEDGLAFSPRARWPLESLNFKEDDGVRPMREAPAGSTRTLTETHRRRGTARPKQRRQPRS